MLRITEENIHSIISGEKQAWKITTDGYYTIFKCVMEVEKDRYLVCDVKDSSPFFISRDALLNYSYIFETMKDVYQKQIEWHANQIKFIKNQIFSLENPNSIL